MPNQLSVNDDINNVVINNANQNIIITTDGVDNEVSVTQPTTSVVVVNDSPNITIIENNVEGSYNDQITVSQSTLGTSIVSIVQPDTTILVVNSLGPQGPVGPQGPQGPAGTGTIDTSSFVTTSSFNVFTSSYYVDSASFNTRINNISVDTSSLVTTSSFNALTSSFNSFTSSYYVDSSSFNLRINTLVNATSSYVLNSQTGSFVTTSSFNSFTSSYNTGSFSGSFVGTASWATRAITSSYALQAQNAATATTAGTANQSEAVLVYGYNTHENGVEYSFLIPRAYNISPGDEAQSALVSNDDFTYISYDSGTPVFLMPVSSSTFIIGVEGENEASLVVHGEVKATKFTTLTNTIEFTDLITSGSRPALLTLSVSSSNLVVSGGGIFSNVTGSLLGTASFAQSSSTALTASFLPIGTYNITSSWANNYNETDPIFVAKSASLATTGSNTFKASQVITGSLTITNDLIVLGSSSITYISQSTLDIATNLITINTNTPSVRFGGLAVIDSGSSPQRSGSILFDSQNDQWIFVHQSTGGAITSSVFIQGPQTFNNVGNETTITTNRLTKGTGGDLGEHIGDSNITDTGTVVSINSNTEITGSLIVTNGITSSLFGTSSWANNFNETDPIFTSKSGSFVTTSSFNNFTSSIQNQVNSLTNATSSYALASQTGSFVTTSSFNSFTSSYTTGSFTGSFTGQLNGIVTSASYAITASYALSSPGGGGISETLAIAYAIALG